MTVKALLVGLAPRALLGVGALFFVFGWVTWENLAWRATYNGVQPGMTMTAVLAEFKSMEPAPRSCTATPGGFWKRESARHLIIAGPNRWKYVFYLDNRNRVGDKARWGG